MADYNPEEIDPEFLLYLNRINKYNFVDSLQCCSGHMEYERSPDEGLERSGKWGYLQLLMDIDFAEWLNETIRYCNWLLLDMSQLWDDRAWKLPGVTEDERFVLTFAWDSSSWPTPAEEICELIEKYNILSLENQYSD